MVNIAAMQQPTGCRLLQADREVATGAFAQSFTLLNLCPHNQKVNAYEQIGQL